MAFIGIHPPILPRLASLLVSTNPGLAINGSPASVLHSRAVIELKQSGHGGVIISRHYGVMEILDRINQYDQQMFAVVFRQHRRAAVVGAANLLSRSGEGYLHVLVLAVAWQLQSPLFPALAVLTLTAFALERCIHKLLKQSFQRPRPEQSFDGVERLGSASSTFSFPSGHSSRAFLLATALCVIFAEVAAISFLWAGAVGLSRVVLGVHYPGDALAGAAVGCGTTLVTALALGLI